MTTYDVSGNPVLPAGVEEFLSGNPSTYIDRFLRTRYGPIVKDVDTGVIADDPSDVVVLVNSSPATVKAVIGLLGIIVLENAPTSTDVVKVWYNYLPRTKVEFRRLNSTEFVLNADGQRAHGCQRYLYQTVLVDPSLENPSGFQGGAPQTDPELVGHFYRAFERAYSVALNDPNLLLLNAPYHKVSYPAFSRTLTETLASYDGNVLPENNISYPWSVHGSGVASVAGGILTLEDSSSGSFPTGDGAYYYRAEDLSFPYNMSFSFRSVITSYTLAGEFSGVGAGFIDGNYLCLLSFLESSGTKYVGMLKKDGDETLFSSYESYELDWSVNHIYRLYRTVDQVFLYVDSGSLPVLTLSVSDLARGNELEISIPFISGSFFGSLNREATNISEWDYLRYLITPESLNESSHTVTVLYEANNLPKDASYPWFTTGAFGTETLLGLETLLLNKISASEEPYGSESGFLTGEIFGYHRPEPFLTDQSTLTVDWKSRAYSWTHDISERSLGVFVNDFTKFLGVSFFSDTSLNLLSYNGQMVPEDDPETPWGLSGSASISVLDNYLKIVDSSDTTGALYSREDTANEILGFDQNYIFEFRTRVNSYTADASGFVGVLASVFDGVPGIDSGPQVASLSNTPVANTVTITGLFSSTDVGRQIEISGSTQGNDGIYDIISFISVNQVQVSSLSGTIPEASVTANLLGGYPGRSVQIQLREEGSGTQVISFSSNGSVLSSIPYTWDDEFHTYRVIVNQDSDLVLLMVDGVTKGSLAYSSFTKSAGDTATYSFGSSNSLETSISDVDWDYFNSYPIRDSGTDYVGIYKGGDVSDLNSYNYVTIDFSSYHEYRLVRDPNGSVSLFIDGTLRITLPYLDLPDISGSYFYPQNSSGIYWGSYDESALVLSEWDYIRYSISGLTGLDIAAPHHQILNQQNVIASADHLYVNGHDHTNFLSSSTGIPTPYDGYYNVRGAEDADTQLNVDTPPVPLTEEAYLTKVETPIATLNDPLFSLNDVQFLSNDSSTKVELEVNERGLYNTLDLRSKSSGNDSDKIYPAFDNGPVGISFDVSDTLSLLYEADLVPELEGWTIEGSGDYSSFSSSGILTFSNWGSGSRYYLNENPIFSSDFITAFEFSFKVTQDISSGSGDTEVRFKLNNGSINLELGLYTSPLDEKIVQIFSGGVVVGNISFDWDDGSYHTYKLQVNPYTSMVSVYIDSNSRSYMDIPFSKLVATNDVSLSFTPKTDPFNVGTSEIEIDFVRFYVYRNDDYELPSDVNEQFFYLNAYEDFSYTSYTVPAKSLLNSDNLLYAGSKFNEAFPELNIEGQIEETYTGVSDSPVADDIVLTYPWGGNILNDSETTMELNMVTGFLLNDFTSGGTVHPLNLSPAITTAVLGATLVISGSNLLEWSLDHNHTVRITGDGAVDLTSTAIIGAGGSWTATTIVIPLSLVVGVSAGTSQALVQVYGIQSNVVTIS